MAYHLIQMNFVPLILCVLFAVYILVDRCFDERVRGYFLATVITIIVLIGIDDIEYVEIKSAYPTISRMIELTLGYMLRPHIAIFVTAIFAHSNRKKVTKKRAICYLIPLALNYIVLIANIWNRKAFTLGEHNEFIRGPLGYITFVVGFLYMGLMVLVSIQSVQIRKKGESVVVIMLAILCVVGTMMESWYGYVGFLSGASIVGVVLYYLYLHVSVFSRDALTAAYNRRIFDLDMERIKDPVIFVSMDLNHLKQINDTQGHAKGDEFISSFAREMMKNVSKSSQLYRLGGDEFALVCRKTNEEHIKRRINRVQERLNKEGYSFAYGIIKIRPGDDIEKFMDVVDQLMYEKKMRMKREEIT